ncbi:MAG: transposase [bacterium]|nr:transposase [bacterium]
MGRPLRIAVEGLPYHVVNRGNGRQAVFLDDEDFEKYVELLRRYKKEYCFELYHWVLMNNHFHLLLETTNKGSVSKIMQGITLAHTRYFNHKYKSVGHVWQGRFKSPIIEKDSYLLECARYVELNPVRVGLVKDPGDYKYSSYRFYSLGETDGLTDEDPLYKTFGKDSDTRHERYCEFVNEGLRDEVLSKIRGSLSRGDVLGTTDFVEKFRDKLGLPLKRRPRGRPRKQK